MTVGDRGVLSDDEVRLSVLLVCIVFFAAGRETTYPIGSANRSTLF